MGCPIATHTHTHTHTHSIFQSKLSALIISATIWVCSTNKCSNKTLHGHFYITFERLHL